MNLSKRELNRLKREEEYAYRTAVEYRLRRKAVEAARATREAELPVELETVGYSVEPDPTAWDRAKRFGEWVKAVLKPEGA